MPGYDTMEAGREMDCLIAEKIFGKVKCQGESHLPGHRMFNDGRFCYADPTSPDQGAEVSLYSSDISAAWEVVEEMGAFCFRRWQDGTFEAGFGHQDRDDCWEFMAQAPTAPLTICRAALKAIGK